MTKLRALKLALAITIALFAFAGAYTSYTIVERQEQLREVSRYNIVWASAQALAELHRLQYRVAGYAAADKRFDKAEVLRRFDIMFNRLGVLRGGDVAALTDQFPDLKPVVAELEATLNELDPIFQAIDAPGATQRILDRLAPLELKLIRFAASANQFGGMQVAEDQQSLLTLHQIFSASAAGLFLCGVAFIALLFLQNRMIRKAHDALRALARDLELSKDAAVAGNEAKSRFLANMSHELRTPLNAIIGFSEIIAQESFGPIGQARYRDYATDIMKSGRHMHELVNDILTMAKLDAGRFELYQEEIELWRTVKGVLRIFMGTEMAQGREIVVAEGVAWPRLQADKRALKQMLLNLLSNAVKFSSAPAPVEIGWRVNAAGEGELTVTDQGIGMTETEAELAVKPFHQVDNSTARRYEGTGLGLSIVKAMIEMHGGRLRIVSTVGQGTAITLIFPAEALAPGALVRAA